MAQIGIDANTQQARWLPASLTDDVRSLLRGVSTSAVSSQLVLPLSFMHVLQNVANGKYSHAGMKPNPTKVIRPTSEMNRSLRA